MDAYTISPECFTEQMLLLAKQTWRVEHLEEALEFSTSASARSVVLTFDDGFASNRLYAWPVLEKLRFAATTFLVSGRLGLTNTWDEAATPRYPLLAAEDLCSIDPGLMRFGSHSATHPNLVTLSKLELAGEVNESLARLEYVLGRRVGVFAYPFGSWNWRIAASVRNAGYRAACSCIGGLNTTMTDRFLLRRVEVTERDRGWRFEFKLRTGRALTGWPPGELQLVRAAVRSQITRRRAR